MRPENRIYRRFLLIVIALLLSLTACTTVHPFEKMYLNDEEMTLDSRDSEFLENQFQVYREAASGASGGGMGGGCGCN